MLQRVRAVLALFVSVIAAVFVVSVPPAAAAQAYWGGSLAVLGTDDVSNAGRKTTFNRGFRLDLALGFEDVNPITDRLEMEFAYRKADVDEISNALVTQRVDGDVTYFAAFANAYHDMEYLSFRYGNRWTPYVGGGVGYATVHANGIASDTLLFNTVDDSDDVYIYQGMAGLDYAYSPYTVVSFGYRYTESNRDDPVTWVDSGGIRVQAEHVTDHQFEWGGSAGGGGRKGPRRGDSPRFLDIDGCML